MFLNSNPLKPNKNKLKNPPELLQIRGRHQTEPIWNKPTQTEINIKQEEMINSNSNTYLIVEKKEREVKKMKEPGCERFGWVTNQEQKREWSGEERKKQKN